MARPTQQTFSASIGSSLKSGPYLSHFYSGEERLLRSNSSKRRVIQIPLIVPPVSHKEIRRILGWLLLPLSSWLVPTESTKKHPSLGAPNRTQVGVCSNNPDVPCNTSPHLYSPKIWVPISNPSGDPSNPGLLKSPGSCGLKTICPTISHN